MSFGFVSLCLLLGFDCYCLLFVLTNTTDSSSEKNVATKRGFRLMTVNCVLQCGFRIHYTL